MNHLYLFLRRVLIVFLVSTFTFVSSFTGNAIADVSGPHTGNTIPEVSSPDGVSDPNIVRPFINSCSLKRLQTSDVGQPDFENPPFIDADRLVILDNSGKPIDDQGNPLDISTLVLDNNGDPYFDDPYFDDSLSNNSEYLDIIDNVVTLRSAEGDFTISGNGQGEEKRYTGYLYEAEGWERVPDDFKVPEGDQEGDQGYSLPFIDVDSEDGFKLVKRDFGPRFTPPVIEVSPSSYWENPSNGKVEILDNSLKLNLINDLPVKLQSDLGKLPQTKENLESVSQYTNMHYHGFNVSPLLGGDDVLVEVPSNVTPIPVPIPMEDEEDYRFIPVPPFSSETTPAFGTYEGNEGNPGILPGGYYKGDTPGESKYGGPVTKYRMNFLIPDIHQSGLMWFHSHAHSLSSQQVNSGLSGAIIIKGNEDYYGQFSKPKRPLLVQQRSRPELTSDREEFPANSLSPEIKQQVMLFKDFTNRYFGESKDDIEDCFLLNSQVNPKITIEPGEIQLWRVGNIGSEKYMNIALETVKGLNGNSLSPNDSPNDWNRKIKSDSYTIMNNGDGPNNKIPITFTKDPCQEGDDECREYDGNLIFNVSPLSDGVTVINKDLNHQATFTLTSDDNVESHVEFEPYPSGNPTGEFEINGVELELNQFVLEESTNDDGYKDGYKVRGNIRDGQKANGKSSKVIASIDGVDGVQFTGYFDFEDNNKYSFTTTTITNPEEIPISEFAEPWENPNFYILARDGDVVEHPVATNSILLPPGARAEFLVVGGKAGDEYYLVSDLSSHMTEKDQDLGNDKNKSYILATVETVADQDDPAGVGPSEYDYTNTIGPTSTVTPNSVTCKVSANGVDEDCTEDNKRINLDYFIRNSEPFKVDKILPTPSDLAGFESCDSSSGGINFSNLRNISNKLVKSIPNKIPEASPYDLDHIFDQLPGLCVNAPDKYKDPLTKKRYFYFSGADRKNFLKGFEKSQLFESPQETDIATDPPGYYNIDKDKIKEAFDGNRIDKISHIGDIEDWHLVNTDGISHVFHIHQLDFLVTKVTFVGNSIEHDVPETYNNYTVNKDTCIATKLPYREDTSAEKPELLDGFSCGLETQGYRDVINLPAHSETVVRIPFVNPFITGVFVYHCHILAHEDNGMMHNIKVINPKGYREIDMKAFKELIREAIKENSKENS